LDDIAGGVAAARATCPALQAGRAAIEWLRPGDRRGEQDDQPGGADRRDAR
jgi:hypothetical protein